MAAHPQHPLDACTAARALNGPSCLLYACKVVKALATRGSYKVSYRTWPQRGHNTERRLHPFRWAH